jgi:hypothetical protein
MANRSVWNVAIRWAKFPHEEIRADIYSRLNLNAVERSADDSAQHILRRRLYLLDPEEHRRFIQLESRHIVEHVRCTRDAYRAFTNGQRCNPAAEAYWVILRFAVLPTAIACLQRSVFDYVKLTRIWAADLSLLFGIPTRFRHYMGPGGSRGELKPNDSRPANDDEIRALAETVNENTMLRVEDGGVWHPCGGGPFAIDDSLAAESSWGLCALSNGMTLTGWIPIRQKLWRAKMPWTEGLSTLFGCLQDELLCQWRNLPREGKAQEARWKRRPSALESVVVPEQRKDALGRVGDSLVGATQSHLREPSVTDVAPGVAKVEVLVDGYGTPADGARLAKDALRKRGLPSRAVSDYSRIVEAIQYKKKTGCTFTKASVEIFGDNRSARRISYHYTKRKGGGH